MKKNQQLSKGVWVELGRTESTSRTITKQIMFNFWHSSVLRNMWLGMNQVCIGKHCSFRPPGAQIFIGYMCSSCERECHSEVGNEIKSWKNITDENMFQYFSTLKTSARAVRGWESREDEHTHMYKIHMAANSEVSSILRMCVWA